VASPRVKAFKEKGRLRDGVKLKRTDEEGFRRIPAQVSKNTPRENWEEWYRPKEKRDRQLYNKQRQQRSNDQSSTYPVWYSRAGTRRGKKCVGQQQGVLQKKRTTHRLTPGKKGVLTCSIKTGGGGKRVGCCSGAKLQKLLQGWEYKLYR